MTGRAARAHPRGMENETTPPAAPEFTPTHELVQGGKVAQSLRQQEDGTFINAAGKIFTRGILDRMGATRRVV